MEEEAYDPDAPAYSMPTGSREPDMDKAPPQNENTKWDEDRGVWVWNNNGSPYVWNEFKQIFLPDVRNTCPLRCWGRSPRPFNTEPGI